MDNWTPVVGFTVDCAVVDEIPDEDSVDETGVGTVIVGTVIVGTTVVESTSLFGLCWIIVFKEFKFN